MTPIYLSTKWNNGQLSMIIAAIILSFIVNTIFIKAQQPDDNTNAFGCTLCADGSVPNFDATIGETSCRTIANAIFQTPANSELCVMTQLQGYINCNCPTFPTDTYCSMCNPTSDDGTRNTTDESSVEEFYYNRIPTQNRDKVIPDTNLTCSEAEFIQKNTSTMSCASLLPDTAAEYCGCPSLTKKTCFLCEDNTSNMEYMNRLLPPYFTTSCGSLDRSIGVLVSSSDNDDNDDNDDKNKCRGGGTNSTLDAILQTIPVAVQEYCGCASILLDMNVSESLDTTCHICGNGTVGVRNPNATVTINNTNVVNEKVRITCTDLDIVTRYIMITSNDDKKYCTTLSTQYESICCSSDPFSASTTTTTNRTARPRIQPIPNPSSTNRNNTNNNVSTPPTSTSSSITSSSSKKYTTATTNIYPFISLLLLILF